MPLSTDISKEAPLLLLVDDEEEIRRMLSFALEQEGYRVALAGDGEEALRLFSETTFDLVVLDLMLPGISGMEVCRRIRAASNLPIIMLTARSQENDKVLGFELGADDYITKPFGLAEFRSRIKALLRRTPAASQETPDLIEVEGLRVDLVRRQVSRDGEPVELTYKEFELLKTLLSRPGRILNRDTLLHLIWGDTDFRDKRTVDVHIRHLREKIERDPANPQFIFTSRGLGYQFRTM